LRNLVRHNFSLAAGTILLSSGTATAHVGGPFSPGGPWWAGWNFDPAVLLALGLLAGLYARGLARVWRAGAGRGVAGWQVWCFAAGFVALVVALVSPLDPLSDELSSAHMVQHMVLMNVAAPLLVLGSPTLVVLSGVPAAYRRPLGRLWRRLDPVGPAGAPLWNPVVVWLAYAAVLWGWHLPPLYQAALRDPVVHDFQHLTFFAAAFLFWRAALDPLGRRRLGVAAALVSLFTTALHATVLGVFMTLAPYPWYPDYHGRTEPWGLTPLEDQQLAGLIMWMPACSAYAVAAAGLLAAAINARPRPYATREVAV
jgi:putative membrane protein